MANVGDELNRNYLKYHLGTRSSYMFLLEGNLNTSNEIRLKPISATNLIQMKLFEVDGHFLWNKKKKNIGEWKMKYVEGIYR